MAQLDLSRGCRNIGSENKMPYCDIVLRWCDTEWCNRVKGLHLLPRMPSKTKAIVTLISAQLLSSPHPFRYRHGSTNSGCSVMALHLAMIGAVEPANALNRPVPSRHST